MNKIRSDADYLKDTLIKLLKQHGGGPLSDLEKNLNRHVGHQINYWRFDCDDLQHFLEKFPDIFHLKLDAFGDIVVGFVTPAMAAQRLNSAHASTPKKQAMSKDKPLKLPPIENLALSSNQNRNIPKSNEDQKKIHLPWIANTNPFKADLERARLNPFKTSYREPKMDEFSVEQTSAIKKLFDNMREGIESRAMEHHEDSKDLEVDLNKEEDFWNTPNMYENYRPTQADAFSASFYDAESEIDEAALIRNSSFTVKRQYDDKFSQISSLGSEFKNISRGESLDELTDETVQSTVKKMPKESSENPESRMKVFYNGPNPMLVDDPFMYCHLEDHNRDIKKRPDPQTVIPKDKWKSMPIQITESYSPSHFWFNWAGPEGDNIEAMECLLDDYYDGFQKRGDFIDLRFDPSNVKQGLVVAAYSVYRKHWCRALILEVLDDEKVLLFYFDYGTTQKNIFSNLKYLLNKWLTAPKFCRRGRLAGFQPFNGLRYPIDDLRIFNNELEKHAKVKGKYVADCVNYLADEDCYEFVVYFIDIGDNFEEILEDMKIFLKKEKIVKEEEDGQAKPYLVNPNFHSLETGAHPSYETLWNRHLYQHVEDIDFSFEIIAGDLRFEHLIRKMSHMLKELKKVSASILKPDMTDKRFPEPDCGGY